MPQPYKFLSDFLVDRVGGTVHRSPSAEEVKESFSQFPNEIDKDEQIKMLEAIVKGPTESFLIRGIAKNKVHRAGVLSLVRELYEGQNLVRGLVSSDMLRGIRNYQIDVCGFKPGDLQEFNYPSQYVYRGNNFGVLVRLGFIDEPYDVVFDTCGEVWDVKKLEPSS